MNFTFSTIEKLKSRKQIEQLFVEGDSFKEYPIRMKYLKLSDKNLPVKVAFSVPKRNFKLAVDRNRIKRLLREAYRKNKSLFLEELEGEYIVMFLYTDRVEWKQLGLERKMLKLMKKLIKSQKKD